MNEVQVEQIKEGLEGLRSLLAGKHLRPAELALTVYIVSVYPDKATEVFTDIGKQARWEVVDGTS